MSVKIHQQLSAVREPSARPLVEEVAHIAQIKVDGLGNGNKSDKYGEGTLPIFEVASPVMNFRGEISSSTYHFGNGHQRPDTQVHLSTDFSPSTEHGTPPYFRWAQDLHHLLMDIEGVNLFKKYLSQERCETRSLDFWFACEGLKKADPKRAEYIQQVIRLIYKRFVKKALKEINSETKQDIAEKISSKSELDQAIFDIAQKEVEEVIMKTTYPNFLKSDVYLQHIQLMQNNVALDSPKIDALSSASEASSSTNSRDGLDILPTLHEDSELQMEPRTLTSCRKTFGHHNKFLESSRLKPEAQAGHYLQSPSQTSNSCHVKYASFLPSSVQDSELQSLSSDAHTDDTLSLTDSSSVDCGPVYSSKSYHKKQRRAAKRNATINKDYLFHHNFIPRTQRLPKESTMQMEPAQLAAILIDKLAQVKKDQDAQEKIVEYLHKIEGEDRSLSKLHIHSSVDCLAGLPSQLLTVSMRDKLTTIDESDQSILDQHVSRVWNDSTHHTPSRSPGYHSPPLQPHSPALPDRRRSAPIGGNVQLMMRSDSAIANLPSCHNTLISTVSQSVHRTCRNLQYSIPHHTITSNRHKKERDTYSSDSGTVHDFTPENEPVSLPHQPVFSHKHNHRVNGASLPPSISRPTAVSGDQHNILPTEHHVRRTKETRRAGSKKTSTATDSSSSCVDSGVSVACDSQPLSASAHERVYNWVLDNEKYSSSIHGPDSEKDTSSRHKKTIHSSTFPVMGKLSHTKKPVMYNSSRSGTLEHGTTPWPLSPALGVGPVGHECPHVSHSCAHSHCGVQPSQPVAQDLSMPILPPPDTTTQLVEARRRLQDEARGKQTKSKTNSSGRERQSHIDMSKSRICSKIIEVDENFAHKKTVKKSHLMGIQENIKPVINEMTVIGYCFGSEPVPYLTKLPGKNITLKQFKSLLSKKGNYRYFFKKASDEFGTGVVFEEILEDNEILPLWEGKIFANIETAE